MTSQIVITPFTPPTLQDDYVEDLSSSVQKLADHWKAEAERQAELGRKAGSAEYVAQAERMQVRHLHVACMVRGGMCCRPRTRALVSWESKGN